MPEAVLPADLAKLARPIREDTGNAGVRQAGIGGVAAAVEPTADGPAAIYAVFRRGVHAKGVFCLKKTRERSRKLVARAPDQLGTEQKGIVDCAAQRFPAERRVTAVQIRSEEH